MASGRIDRKSSGMPKSDRVRFAGVMLLVSLLSGTCWYAASKSGVSWRDHEGTVVSRRQIMPGMKRMYPVKYEVTIREASGEFFTFRLSRDDWRRAQPGAVVHRDRFGNVAVNAASRNRTRQ